MNYFIVMLNICIINKKDHFETSLKIHIPKMGMHNETSQECMNHFYKVKTQVTNKYEIYEEDTYATNKGYVYGMQGKKSIISIG